ncbi:carotenoid 1,2-hydratase [Povalibacter sp.]|uniref:lipocalin-like domain-containing protein n=1 Tax=Povalibacter sp. TaxID=1962978 RepID=UPI002F4042C6
MRVLVLAIAVLGGGGLSAVAAEVVYLAVVPGYSIEFPRDEGSHPQFRTEWWYVTGWLETPQGEPLGFQVTFFRTRPGTQEDNPSRFAAKQVLFAHAALSDSRRGKLLRGERAAREGFELAYARTGGLDVAIDDWSLRRLDDGDTQTAVYRAVADAADFSLDLQLRAQSPPLLNGNGGYSQKGPDPESASYYYSRPGLQVEGTLRTVAGTQRVRGEAWLDHEWSTAFLDSQARGWDWIGLNLDDGSALMASRIRDAAEAQRWAFASVRSGQTGEVQTFAPDEIDWRPLRRWRSPRTGIEYPVEWQVRVGARTLRLRPSMDDQESDTRESTGIIYWEGAVTAFDEQDRAIGRGYLELTGYGAKLRF